MGKGKVTLGDWLLVIGIVAVGAAVVGALTGYYGARAGLSTPLRTGITGAYVGLAGVFARSLLKRRMKARSTPGVQV